MNEFMHKFLEDGKKQVDEKVVKLGSGNLAPVSTEVAGSPTGLIESINPPYYI